MIADILAGLRKAGVLGMNRRNADYIMRCNPRSSYPRVDNKVLTKQLAEEHGIPTPRLHHVVHYHGDIPGLAHVLDGLQRFVLKPARGAGGSGIVLITGRTTRGFVTQSGDVIPWAELSYHVSDILSGIYSLSALEDKAIIEEMVLPDRTFAGVSYEGIPDMRIIVYKGVPVMGMVRLPTRQSDGKANLHRGALGAGIGISEGTTLDAVHRSEIVTHHPDTGKRIAGIPIPHWKTVLLIAASALEMTGLGYVGVDVILDRRRGPLLLEMNVRPGLAIQIANRSGLRPRLDLVEKAPSGVLANAEARVQWARENFRQSFVSEGFDRV